MMNLLELINEEVNIGRTAIDSNLKEGVVLDTDNYRRIKRTRNGTGFCKKYPGETQRNGLNAER